MNSCSYRYGFNGQERETQLNPSITSAEYWFYDGRLGRRWNVDPVVKPWRSPYDAFRNCPLLFIDPNGDDDFYDNTGKFIGNNGIGSEIRIINSNTSYKEAISNIPNNTKLLTDFSYCVDNEDNIKMLLRIVDCYAYEAGVRQDIDSKFFNESQYKDVAAGYNPKGGYLVAIYEPDGSINKDYQDYNNVINTFAHELEHEINPNTYKPFGHIDAVMAQVNHSSWDKTTREHKQNCASYIVNLLNESLVVENTDLNLIKSKIDEVNNSDVGNYSTLFYNEETKIVESVDILPEVIITPNGE